MRITNTFKAISLASMMAFTPVITNTVRAQNQTGEQSYQNTDLRPGGITDSTVLAQAPNPRISVKGKTYNAIIAINTFTNMLYRYDKDGNAIIAYKVGTGTGCSTQLGVYSYENIEYYPYDKAPKGTMRNTYPSLFGRAGIIMNVVDTKTGQKRPTGIMIHGSENGRGVGYYASAGCTRMLEPDILDLVKSVSKEPKGSYIYITAE